MWLSNYLKILVVILVCGLSGVVQAEPLVGLKASAGEWANTDFSKLAWQPIQLPFKQPLNFQSPTIDLAAQVAGQIATIAVPADQGNLSIKVSSALDDHHLYAMNVLVLNQQKVPERYYPFRLFHYKKAVFLKEDRVEGEFNLAPSPGQKFIYLLVFTTRHDLKGQTVLTDPAKVFAAGTNSVQPNIPDPVASHGPSGLVTISITSHQNNVIGNQPVSAALPTKVSSQTQQYFDHAVAKAVAKGNINQALDLINEAERLGIHSSRKIFIKALKAEQSQ
ncbi:MalM family protein [Celerinatantimonas yamalensis]|uniref:MalM family protein n=1 Tax=Celerinatantimonas yamalensis TaxID=559956 RepID=A0ABW9G939_9GAMM